MTMRIDGDKGLIPQNSVKKTQQQQGAKDAEKGAASDKVSFSSVLQQAGQTQETAAPLKAQPLEGLNAPLLNAPAYVQDVNETQETARAAKVEELKAQIADGSYQPDLKKVAGSLLKFIAEGRQV
ncbi:flagellar biosynthesis anti-sigma factor FlgM [Desulfuromonas acetoxidans]|uniref:Negative regulator of flagellin synthesis n=1 Tax=Desulfuromonas acetoxidans (strain DSM 684 / 11070) TaxID=281689 RepID=Q1JZQ7_DESA6|nr:flagellar biosynthesis anti-sigma factor FlgM [Desulfuromonas acetoxidans]EAT15835.1 anti-sigma-28 factor, FlgM [Desulfuromonas acetoxidans DSM 684]MBF0644963.1 flagellar biosynthesis anti-sigma factor FlgM [Desulfuromonas acetoxidans]NVD25620.1 flagellar biosynthesis anti-sigma factor FlgM [Desulfuromonas acetoxidans]NVE17672.1 flagellar biosynthesis anti-sigma factor FlgM [Desulfuromonas acetoxidans]